MLLQDIDELCTECSNLIDNHEKIQVLSAVHYNLGKTLQDVENIVALPHEAAEAEEMLRDDTQLLQVTLHMTHDWINRAGLVADLSPTTELTASQLLLLPPTNFDDSYFVGSTMRNT